MRWPWQKKLNNFETVLQRIVAAQEGMSFEHVTPDNCMQSPTVHAIVNAVSKRLSVTPVHVYRRAINDGRESKERLPSHPVARLLQRPNEWQSRIDFWLDATSCYMRWGRFFAYKSRGSTGPIRELIPVDPKRVELRQNEKTYKVRLHVTGQAGEQRDYELSQFLHCRGASRDFLTGNSPIQDVSQAIALEILAERFGKNFFKNGALPLLVFSFMEGAAGFKDEDAEKAFIQGFQDAFSGNNVMKGMLTPKGIEKPTPIQLEHDKAQFLETRKYQRTVIAGAFGVPPHLVGDLERATFNNVEQQDSDFTLGAVMPVAQAFEASMERDLLTDKDRNDGVVIRFNLDSILRADFKSRQEGLAKQREMGIISANDWREIEGRNPLSDDDGGNDYFRPGNMMVAGEPTEVTNEPEPDDSPPD